MSIEGEEPQWIKRIRWAKSGLPSVDDRINLLASLWIEGSIEAIEFNPEIIEALNTSMAPPAADKAIQLEDYANRVRCSAQWVALALVCHFCINHELKSIEERSWAFKIFDEDLNAMGNMLGSTAQGWIANACEFRSQTEDVSDPMHQLVRKWVNGGHVTDHVDLLDQADSAKKEFMRRRIPNMDAPEEALGRWTDVFRASIQSIVLRDTDLYCRAAGFNTPEERTKAWRDMLATLQKPTPGHSK